MLVIDRDNMDGKWIQFEDDEDIQFLIKPLRISLMALRPDSTVSEMSLKIAQSCLMDWKGIKDVNGDDVKFTPENKMFILDSSLRITQFIYEKAIVVNNEMLNFKKKET